MRKKTGILLVSVALACQSCFTTALWQDTDPRARIWIDADKITEAELLRRGLKYEVYNADWGRGYLVKKNALGKMRDYHLRALGTPVTLTVDVATSVLVVGYYMFLLDPEGTCRLVTRAPR
jgi:hypothetical protein